MEKMATKLLVSRMQRDLTDSTALRNLGACFSYLKIGIKNSLKGLNKIKVDTLQLTITLDDNWALIAEPIQTTMRSNDIPGGYELLKTLTRGTKINKNAIMEIINNLKLPLEKVQKLKKGPYSYTGLSEELVDKYFLNFE